VMYGIKKGGRLNHVNPLQDLRSGLCRQQNR
jgi:hypothetical protein